MSKGTGFFLVIPAFHAQLKQIGPLFFGSGIGRCFFGFRWRFGLRYWICVEDHAARPRHPFLLPVSGCTRPAPRYGRTGYAGPSPPSWSAPSTAGHRWACRASSARRSCTSLRWTANHAPRFVNDVHPRFPPDDFLAVLYRACPLR